MRTRGMSLLVLLIAGCGKQASPSAAVDPAAKDVARLEGVWAIETLDASHPGESYFDPHKSARYAFHAGRLYSWRSPAEFYETDAFKSSSFSLDVASEPRQITLQPLDEKGEPCKLTAANGKPADMMKPFVGLYRFEGEKLAIAIPTEGGSPRPRRFNAQPAVLDANGRPSRAAIDVATLKRVEESIPEFTLQPKPADFNRDKWKARHGYPVEDRPATSLPPKWMEGVWAVETLQRGEGEPDLGFRKERFAFQNGRLFMYFFPPGANSSTEFSEFEVRVDESRDPIAVDFTLVSMGKQSLPWLKRQLSRDQYTLRSIVKHEGSRLTLTMPTSPGPRLTDLQPRPRGNDHGHSFPATDVYTLQKISEPLPNLEVLQNRPWDFDVVAWAAANGFPLANPPVMANRTSKEITLPEGFASLQGVWAIEKFEKGEPTGQTFRHQDKVRFVFQGDRFYQYKLPAVFYNAREFQAHDVSLVVSNGVGKIDLSSLDDAGERKSSNDGKRGLFKFEGSKLILALPCEGTHRPKGFKAETPVRSESNEGLGSGVDVLTLVKVNEPAPRFQVVQKRPGMTDREWLEFQGWHVLGSRLKPQAVPQRTGQ